MGNIVTDDFFDAMVLAVIGQNGMENGFDTMPDKRALVQAETFPSLLGRVRAAAIIPSSW